MGMAKENLQERKNVRAAAGYIYCGYYKEALGFRLKLRSRKGNCRNQQRNRHPRLSSQQPKAALKQEARRDSLKLGSRRRPLKPLKLRSRKAPINKSYGLEYTNIR